MRNLPFVVQPRRKPEMVRIGNEETGIFEIERRGYLTVGEKAAYQQVVTNKEGTQALRALIDKVSTDTELSKEKSHQLIAKLLRAEKLSSREEKLLEPFTPDIMSLLEVFQREALHSQLLMASILLMSRVNSDWVFDDTAQLDITVIEQLARLYQAEEAKSMEALDFSGLPKAQAAQEDNQPGKDEAEAPLEQ